jgi:hypothetical protein
MVMRTWLAASGTVLGLVVAACGTDPSGPPAVAEIEVSIPAGLLIGDTVTAMATVRDGTGNILTGRTVTFSTSNGAALSIDANGLARAVQAAGPITITATSEGRSGTASVTVRDDQRFAYVWAHSQAEAAYTPTHSWVFSSSGAVNVVRNGTGEYNVNFPGLGAQLGQRENVQVTAYGGMAYCSTSGWQTQGSDLVVGVRCWAPSGAAVDSRYTVFVTGARALSGRTGFLLADQPTATATYRPASAHNSSFGSTTVTRTSPGVYRADLSGINRGGGAGPEMVMVTQVGSGTDRCSVSSWNFNGFLATVTCSDRLGNPVDARFSLLVLEGGRAGQRVGFAWGDNAGAPSYVPSPSYALNSAGGAVAAVRTGPGQYEIRWTNLLKNGTETVLVSAYGTMSRWCRTGQWGNSTATEFSVWLNCFDAAGNLADSMFDVIVIQ